MRIVQRYSGDDGSGRRHVSRTTEAPRRSVVVALAEDADLPALLAALLADMRGG